MSESLYRISQPGTVSEDYQEVVKEPAASPFKTGEIFIAQNSLKELRRKTKDAPRNMRREVLEKHRSKAAFQEEGLTEMQEEVIVLIRANPDISLVELKNHIDEFDNQHNLALLNELDEAYRLAEQYVLNHQAIRSYREQYLDDKDLFEAVFGVKPIGEVEVIEGPMTFFFRCHSLVDYTLIWSESFLDESEVTEEQQKKADLSSGVSILTSLPVELSGLITAENADGRAFDQGSQLTMEHEEQHAIKAMFKEVELAGGLDEEVLIGEPTAEKKELLKINLRVLRRAGEIRAKDEIMAYFKSDSDTAEDLVAILMEPEEQEGLYDYFYESKESLRVILRRGWGDDSKEEIETILKEIFTEEYRKVLEDATEAFQVLREDGHFSIEQSIAFFNHKSLHTWKRKTKSFLEVKGLHYPEWQGDWRSRLSVVS